MPKLNISQFSVYGAKSNNSGAIYPGVPYLFIN